MKKIILLILIMTSVSAYAFGILVEEWVHGDFKFCSYNNGVVIKVPKWQSCPMYIQ